MHLQNMPTSILCPIHKIKFKWFFYRLFSKFTYCSYILFKLNIDAIITIIYSIRFYGNKHLVSHKILLLQCISGLMFLKLYSTSCVLIFDKHPIKTPYPIYTAFWLDNYWVQVLWPQGLNMVWKNVKTKW